MKKIKVLLIAVLCLVMATGCSNAFAKSEYDSNEKIIKTEDRYAKGNSSFGTIDGGYSLTVSEFDGRETLWTDTVEDNQDVEMEISFTLSGGKAKIVHINEEGDVKTIIECTPETCTDEPVVTTVSMTSGRNRLKIVGYDCRDIELEMLFTVAE